MIRNIWRAVFIGIIAGAGLFFIPFFLFKGMVILLIIWGVTRLFSHRRGFNHPLMFAEYVKFKEGMQQSCNFYGRNSRHFKHEQRLKDLIDS